MKIFCSFRMPLIRLESTHRSAGPSHSLRRSARTVIAESWEPTVSRDLRLHQTDQFVWSAISKQPLSVSTDKIGIPALRTAGLMVRLAAGGLPVDRTGASRRFVEVYPAAALRQGGISDAKESTPALLSALMQQAPWLRLPPAFVELCASNWDACDALPAPLVARAAAIGKCEPIPEKHLGIAESEGWIALPYAMSLRILHNATSA